LYCLEECGGNYIILENGIKDCSNCLIPHKKENYKLIMEKLNDKMGY
jgi:Zn-finger protein